MEDSFHTVYQQYSPSVVTIARGVPGSEAVYTTGFILLSEKNYSLILTIKDDKDYETKRRRNKDMYYVYFEEKIKYEAMVLQNKKACDFIILVVEDTRERVAVTFSDNPADYEAVTTISTMAGTKLHKDLPAIESLVGVMGNYKGFVLKPSCEAFDVWGEELSQSDMYFIVRCSMQDNITDFEDIEKEEDSDKEENVIFKKIHTANTMLAAPVFRLLDGKVIGLIYSATDCSDVKIGLHTKVIIDKINLLCGTTTRKITWKDYLKKRVGRISVQLRRN